MLNFITKKSLEKIISNILNFLKKIPAITHITIIYSINLTTFWIILNKIISSYPITVRITFKIFFLLFAAHLGSFTIEDVCNEYNFRIEENVQAALKKENLKILNEMYLPELENKNLNRLHNKFLENTLVESKLETPEKIYPKDFFEIKNLMIAFITVVTVLYFYQ